MNIPLADYKEQRDAFKQILAPDPVSRILLFSGKSGSGKTTLVTVCLGATPDHIPVIPIDLKGSANTVPEILRRVGHRLGWDHLHRFTTQVAALQGIPQLEVDRNWLLGIGNHIQAALRVERPTDRQERRAILTEAWFADLRSFSDPILIAFDTYENAIPDVKDWIAGPFLARAASTPTLRVLVSGQKVPDQHNIAWGNCCVHHELYGVREARHWLPVIDALGRCIPFDPPETWLAGVCHALKGAPKDIMQVIEGLPKKEIAA
jgi:energy-coupling factor transporter ATP-binding protein EcfA2